MLFSFVCEDIPNSLPERLRFREEHRNRLQQLNEEGRLVLAGPNSLSDEQEGFSGSVIIAEFPDLDAAEAWAAQDPYARNGIYRHVSVKPFKKVLP